MKKPRPDSSASFRSSGSTVAFGDDRLRMKGVRLNSIVRMMISTISGREVGQKIDPKLNGPI